MEGTTIYETVNVYADDEVTLSVKYIAKKGSVVWKLLATAGNGTEVHTFTGAFAEIAAKTAFKSALQSWMNDGVSIYKAAAREAGEARALGAMLE